MKIFQLFKKEKLQNFITKHSESRNGTILLAAVSFSESLFFPIPPDVLLMAIISVRKVQRWFFYATVTTAFSILGGVVGYIIGATFFDTFGQGIISFYGLETDFEKIKLVFQDQTFFAILIAALTPIPFKIFTLAGGLFKVNFFIFLLASIVGRATRFYAVSYLTKLYGPSLAKVFFKYFNTISIILIVFITLVLVFVL